MLTIEQVKSLLYAKYTPAQVADRSQFSIEEVAAIASMPVVAYYLHKSNGRTVVFVGECVQAANRAARIASEENGSMPVWVEENGRADCKWRRGQAYRAGAVLV